MTIRRFLFAICVFVGAPPAHIAVAQPYGEPDSGAPGDRMIQNYLRQETDKVSAPFADDIKSLDGWQAKARSIWRSTTTCSGCRRARKRRR